MNEPRKNTGGFRPKSGTSGNAAMIFRREQIPFWIVLNICDCIDPSGGVPKELGMRDEETIDDFSAPEIFVDGFINHTSRDGVMSCIGYRRISGRKITVLRLVWPAVNTSTAIDDALLALGNDIEIGSKRAH